MKRKIRKLTKEHHQQITQLEWVAATLAKREINNKHVGNATDYEDLFQVALYGVCAAVYDWSPTGGKAIHSYAWDRARAYIGHYMRDKSRLIKVPRSIQKTYYSYSEIKNKDPHVKESELLERLKCSVEELQEAKRVSLSTPFQLYSETLIPETDILDEREFNESKELALEYIATLTDEELKLCFKYLRGQIKTERQKIRAANLIEQIKQDLIDMELDFLDL